MDLSKFNIEELKNIKKEIDIELRKRNPDFKNNLINKILYNSNIFKVVEEITYFEINEKIFKDDLINKIENFGIYNKIEEKFLNICENIKDIEKFSPKDFDLKYKYQNELSKIIGYFQVGGEFNYNLVCGWIKDLYNDKSCQDTLGDKYFNSFNSNDKRETSLNYKLGINLDKILNEIKLLKEKDLDIEIFFQDKKYDIKITKEEMFKENVMEIER